MNFKKAYDSVRRDLLMKCLADIGLHDNMLRAIVSMYWRAPLIPAVQGQMGTPFASTCGVKQGNPLSPLLFGVFIDRLEQWLAARVPECGAKVGQQIIRLLLYADDLALIAEKAVHLQQLLKALSFVLSTTWRSMWIKQRLLSLVRRHTLVVVVVRVCGTIISSQ